MHRRSVARPPPAAVVGLFKDRAESVNLLADSAMMFYRELHADAALVAQHLTDAVRPAVAALAQALAEAPWEPAAIGSAFKAVLAQHGLKMPQLAMPVRVLVMGTPQTPSVDQVLALHERQVVLDRLSRA